MLTHRRAACLATRLRSLPAFTLIECVIAILLIDVGLFALMSGTAFVTRATTAAHTRAVAVTAAQGRIDSLAIVACHDTTGRAGHATLPSPTGGEEFWSLVPASAAGVLLRDSVAFTIWGRADAVVVAATAWC